MDTGVGYAAPIGVTATESTFTLQESPLPQEIDIGAPPAGRFTVAVVTAHVSQLAVTGRLTCCVLLPVVRLTVRVTLLPSPPVALA